MKERKKKLSVNDMTAYLENSVRSTEVIKTKNWFKYTWQLKTIHKLLVITYIRNISTFEIRIRKRSLSPKIFHLSCNKYKIQWE